jgi:hypothetical protein
MGLRLSGQTIGETEVRVQICIYNLDIVMYAYRLQWLIRSNRLQSTNGVHSRSVRTPRTSVIPTFRHVSFWTQYDRIVTTDEVPKGYCESGRDPAVERISTDKLSNPEPWARFPLSSRGHKTGRQRPRRIDSACPTIWPEHGHSRARTPCNGEENKSDTRL